MCLSIVKTDYKTIDEALADMDGLQRLFPLNSPLCQQYEKYRTIQATAYNRSQYVADLILVQLKSDFPLPPGFVSDTGVCVLATNISPGAFGSIDPCGCGGQKPIQANWAQFGMAIRVPKPGGGYDSIGLKPAAPIAPEPGTVFRTISVGLTVTSPAGVLSAASVLEVESLTPTLAPGV